MVAMASDGGGPSTVASDGGWESMVVEFKFST